jgi:predicted O-methyltransferase YrrM
MIPQIDWTQLVPGNVRVAIRERGAGVDGNVSPFELEVISKLVKHFDPQVLFEIGTFDGRTTLNLAAHSRPGAQVYTLDLPRAGLAAAGLPLGTHDRKYIDKPASGLRFQGTDVAHKITQLFGDSARFDFRPYYCGVDFIFIDGAHSYHYILNDSQVALRLIRGRGLILWHDYVSSGHCCWPGLVQALHELHAGDPAFRGLKHVAGTALVALVVEAPRRWGWLKGLAPRLLRGMGSRPAVRDSRRPGDLRAQLNVQFQETRVQRGTSFAVRVQARNVGQAVWLPTNAAHGCVNLGCRLYDDGGRQVAPDYWRGALTPAANEPTLPGETRDFEAAVPPPPPGRYVLEFDLVAEGVCWFGANGSDTRRVNVEVL